MLRNIINERMIKGQRWLLLTFLFLHTCTSFYFISKQNITHDEPQYIEYAKRWLHGHPERVHPLDDSKSPVVAICWIPRMARQLINPDYKLYDYGRKDQAEGRYMMILFSLFTGLYVYKWCKDLHGSLGWQMPLLLLLFDPLFLSYSTLITTDVACGAFLVATLYHFRKFQLTKSKKQLLATAIFTALGIITKQSLIFLLLLLPILVLIDNIINKANKPLISYEKIRNTIFFLLIVLFVINLAFFFKGSFSALHAYAFESTSLQSLQKLFADFKWIRVPFPTSFIQSIDLLKAHAELGAGKMGSTYDGVYLFGETRLDKGFWYYYLVVFFYKMPLGTLFLLLAAVFLCFIKMQKKAFATKHMYVIIPIVFFGVVMSFLNVFQIGIRHLLLIFPLLFTGLGYTFQHFRNGKNIFRIVPPAATIYSFISMISYYPDLIPYTNELVGNKKEIYKKVMDSSIDYGQADSAAKTFLAKNPTYKMASEQPDTGHYLVAMRALACSRHNKQSDILWLCNYQPTGLFQNVFLLYHINEDDLKKERLTSNQ